MQSVNLRFVDVTFSYTLSSEPVISSLHLHFSAGWTGLVGPNGSGKTTVAKLATGILAPVSGRIEGFSDSLPAVYCEQETEYPPEGAEGFLFSSDNRAGELRSILGIENDWVSRWRTLSHGERKRFQSGMALWQDPAVLVLDEPANHLDVTAKNMLASALSTYCGTGIIVSHDRDLLDALCSSCVFMKPGIVTMRPGNYSAGSLLEEQEDARREREYAAARDRYRKACTSAALTRQKEQGKCAGLSKRGLAKHDHDSKSKIDGARLTGKDKRGSRKIKLMEKRADLLKDRAGEKYFKRRFVDGVAFQGEMLRRDSIVTVPEGRISPGGDFYLDVPELVVLPSDRIGITGENGTGKSTLMGRILSLLTIPPERIVYIPQEIGEREWERAREDMRDLRRDRLGELLTVVHRLGSEPDRVLSSVSPSPGEKRKIMLGLGILKNPALIMMDEPANHMDIFSLRCIEDSLNEFSGALIVVSHDMRFIQHVTSIEWNLVKKHGCSRIDVKW